MPAGRFKAYVMKERFAEIFQNKAVSQLGVDITSIEAFYTKGKSTGKQDLLEAFEYLVELNNQLKTSGDLSAEGLEARKIALEYFKQKVEAAPLGGKSLVKQFGNSSANKVRGLFGRANVEFKPETQKLKELYKLGYSNVSTKLIEEVNQPAATEEEALAAAETESIVKGPKYFKKAQDGQLVEKYLTQKIDFNKVLKAILDENNLDLAVTLCKAKPDQMTQLSKEVKQQFLESLFEDYRFEDLKSVIKAGVGFAECEIETIKVFSKEDKKQLKSIMPTLERRGVKFKEIEEVETSESPLLLAAAAAAAEVKEETAAEAAEEAAAAAEAGEQEVAVPEQSSRERTLSLDAPPPAPQGSAAENSFAAAEEKRRVSRPGSLTER